MIMDTRENVDLHRQLDMSTDTGWQDRNGDGGRHVLATLLAGLPHAVIIDRRADTLSWDVDAFLELPVARSIRGKTESRLLCRLTADGLLIAGLADEDARDILARGCGEAVAGGLWLRFPTTDDELGTCWDVIQRAYHALAAGSGPARPFLRPMLPIFSRTRLQ